MHQPNMFAYNVLFASLTISSHNTSEKHFQRQIYHEADEASASGPLAPMGPL